MRRVWFSTILLVLTGSARAEDFTGFYAGLNAGYARRHQADRAVTLPGSGSSGAPHGADPDLPPSAQTAATAPRRSGQRRGQGQNGY